MCPCIGVPTILPIEQPHCGWLMSVGVGRGGGPAPSPKPYGTKNPVKNEMILYDLLISPHFSLPFSCVSLFYMSLYGSWKIAEQRSRSVPCDASTARCTH